MADAGEPADARSSFDTSVPHSARVYNYWLGGKDNFEADRRAAEFVIARSPVVLAAVRAQRAFLGRVVHYLAEEARIWQFLDIGTGLPAASNTHEVAQRAAPQARVVYVDNDPMVLLHARALLTSSPEGVTSYIDADARDTPAILAEAASTLDFRRPVAVLLLGVLHSIPEEDDPYAIVRRLADAVPAGSYVVISQLASDVLQRSTDTMRDYNQFGGIPLTPRTRAQFSRFFDGLDLLEPGVTQVHRWRPGSGLTGTPQPIPIYCGVARKA
jgi:hypothetical protein